MQKLKVGVTGVTGFVGNRFMEINAERYVLCDLDLRKNKPGTLDLSGLDAVVHFAGLAHQMLPVPDDRYYQVNVELTRDLITQAKADGVKHFVYTSSTKVFGDNIRGVLNEHSPCTPNDAYGDSKVKAEELVSTFAAPAFSVSIVRPPVVYGPKVKGNILKLMHLAGKKIPLPFGMINNARSMVYVDNLVALINTILEQRAGGTFIAGDKKPVSTEDLVRMIQVHTSGKSKLFPLPFLGKLLIKKIKPALYSRLYESYVIDNTSTNTTLHFTPPYETAEGIAAMVKWYNNQNAKQ